MAAHGSIQELEQNRPEYAGKVVHNAVQFLGVLPVHRFFFPVVEEGKFADFLRGELLGLSRVCGYEIPLCTLAIWILLVIHAPLPSNCSRF